MGALPPSCLKPFWFDRGDDGEIAFPGEGLRGEKLELSRRTRPDSLFLTVGALNFNHPQLVPVFTWFRDNLWLITPEWLDRSSRLLQGKQEVKRDPAFRDSVARLLEVADLGISGIDVVQGVEDEIQFRHRTGSGDRPLEFEGESLGTRSWFTLAAALLKALETGGGRVLDRDSIWLTEKNGDGATRLYPMNSFRPAPRKDENLLRKYMLGSYGGRPNIAPGALAREVEEAI